jgi:ABC-type uncharacterized transport system fused permease/ATPase subunit
MTSAATRTANDKLGVLAYVLKLSSAISIRSHATANNATTSALLLLTGLGIKKISTLARQRASTSSDSEPESESATSKAESRNTVDLIRYCLTVLVGWREGCLGAALVATLALRSASDLNLIYVATAVENSVVAQRSSESLRQCLKAFAWYAIPASVLYSLYHYLLDELAMGMREKLSARLISKYTADNAFYNVGTGSCDGAAPSVPDQVITQDAEELARALTGLLEHLVRPSIDLMVKARHLWHATGPAAPLTMGAYCVVAAVYVNWLRVPASRLVVGEQDRVSEVLKLFLHIK